MNERDIGLLIKGLTDKIKASVDALLNKHGLTFSQTVVIGFLSEHNCCATQKEIEEHMRVSHPTVVGIISRLERNGFVTCFTDEKNRRNKMVCMTDKANSIVSVMSADKKKIERKLTKGLSDAELEEFRRILDILYKNI